MAEDAKDFLKKVNKLSETYKSLGEPKFVRSGSIVLDAVLGGGIPRGTFILWSAENGCGKSTGSLYVSSAYCKQGLKVLYLDFEGGVNLSQLEGCELTQHLFDAEKNPDGRFFLYRVQTYRDAETILDEIMVDVDLVVIDSITAALTEKVKGSSSEDVLPGQDARVQATFLKKYKAEATRNGVTWIMINQMRTHIRFMGATTDEEAGGNALKFYSDIRLSMKKAYKGVLEKEEDTANGKQKVPFGALCQIWTEKNRYERPKIPLNIAIIFGQGIENAYAYYDFLTQMGCIKKNNAWFTVKMGDLEGKENGSNKVIDWIKDHKADVKKFIDENGGFKLLMKEDAKISLDNPDDDLYDRDVIKEAFEVVDENGEPADE